MYSEAHLAALVLTPQTLGIAVALCAAGVVVTVVPHTAGMMAVLGLGFERAEAVYDVPGECRSDTRLGLGRLALASGDHSTAFAFISEATQLDPGHFNAHFERALISVELIAKEPSICVEAVDALVQSAIHMEALIGTSSQLLRLKERLAQLELWDVPNGFWMVSPKNVPA